MLQAALLLLIVAVVDSQPIGTSATAASRFDFTLCKERMCLVSGCDNREAVMFEEYFIQDACKILLAIWPYTEKKWRVTIQTLFDAPEGIVLQIVNDIVLARQTSKQEIVTCTKDGTSVAVKTRLTSYSIEGGRGLNENDYFICEFNLITTTEQIISATQGYVQLKYGKKMVHLTVNNFKNEFAKYKDMCNPDTIEYAPSLADSSQRFEPVNSTRFAVTCPGNYSLMFANATEPPSEVSAIVCHVTPEKKYGYKITQIDGAEGEPLPVTQNFTAYCARSVCTLCQPVVNCTPLQPDCPAFTPADRANKSSCAELTCPGDRFAINGETTVAKARCEGAGEHSGWTVGTHKNVTAASCAQHVECPHIDCMDNSCTISNGTVTCLDTGLTIHANSTAIKGLTCNKTTGQWMQAFLLNESTAQLPYPLSTNFSCSSNYTAMLMGMTMGQKHMIVGSVVSLWLIGGITMCYVCNRMYGLGDNDNPRDTPQLRRLVERERAKMARERELLQQHSGTTDSVVPTTSSTILSVNSAMSKEMTRSELQTALPSLPQEQVTQPTSPLPHAPRSMPRAAPQPQRSSAPPSTDNYNDNQYEPIPDLEPPLVTAMPAGPSAERASAERVAGSAEKVSRPAAADDQYEPLEPMVNAPPPPPPPKKPNPDEEYVMIDPSAPPPVTPPARTSQRHLQQRQPGGALTDATPPKASSKYYDNSKQA